MYNIMIVDDEESVVSFIEESLHLEGFNTIIAYNGREVLEKLNDTIHLIVLDIKMPFLNGFELLNRLKMGLFRLFFLLLKIILILDSNVSHLALKIISLNPFIWKN